MLLSAVAFASLATTCAPNINPADLASLARVESSFNTLAIHDNNSGQSYSPQTEEDAIAEASALLRDGHSIDMGIMQINSKNLDWLGLTVETAFQPCDSIKAAYRHLTAFSRYNTGSSRRGFENGYVTRVVSPGSRRLKAHAEPEQPPKSPADTTGGDTSTSQGGFMLENQEGGSSFLITTSNKGE